MVTEDLEILNELHDGKLNETIHNIYVHHPLQHEDMAGAVQGLFRLHEVYRFSCEDFSNGIIDGKTTREPLTAHDLYTIATVAVELRKYFFATKYFRLTLKAIGYGFNPQELNPAKVRFELAQNYEKSGKYYKAIKQAKRAKSLSKDFKLKAMKLINDANHLVQIGFKGPKIRNPFSDKYKRNGKFSERKEMILFSQVCRGNITKSFKEQSKLKCRYVSHSFYTKLVKSKVEEFNLKPYIVAFHDVVSDQEVEVLKIIGKPHKKRSKLEVPDDDEGLISKHRVSQVAWFEDLHDDEIAFVTKLYKRISAITGLSLDDSEALQLQNYGIAGHYAPHWDHSTKFDSAPQYFGNRVATFLIYVK
jgi:prolyl 4-hydroxylase